MVSTGSKPLNMETPLHLKKSILRKSKEWLDLLSQSTMMPCSMQSLIYAKFLGKSLPLDQAKLTLADALRGLRAFTIVNLPKGYYYIRHEND